MPDVLGQPDGWVATIYAFIYRTAQQAEQLWRYLTRRHKRRRPRRSRPSRDTIKDRVSIQNGGRVANLAIFAGIWTRSSRRIIE
jgi:IS30 family transposase